MKPSMLYQNTGTSIPETYGTIWRSDKIREKDVAISGLSIIQAAQTKNKLQIKYNITL